MAVVLVGLGTNVGDREGHLRLALQFLNDRLGPLTVSSVYETEPMYVTDQPAFLNAAASVTTDVGPLGVLRLLKRTEQEVGRFPRERFGPREIDLDLIAYGSVSYRYEHIGKVVLQVPHPRVVERRFVLAPVAEIAPDFVLPGLGSVMRLLDATNLQTESVQKREDGHLSLYGVR